MFGAPNPDSPHDLLLKGGHVIDCKNGIDDVRDVAVKDGRISAVETDIPAAAALKVVDVSGLYVTPGLFDFHFHCYAGPEGAGLDDHMTVFPDPFTFQNGVTTVGEAGSSGWRTFLDFKRRVIDRVRTRVLTFLHIVGHGSASSHVQDLADMDAGATAEQAMRYREHIIGIKTADYDGPEWTPYDRALEAATSAGLPWFCDSGSLRPERPISEFMQQRLRLGDIYTHIYAAQRGENTSDGRPVPSLWDGRKRGVLFDVGPGGGSFLLRSAIPFLKEGFVPDIISSDRHLGSSAPRYFLTDLLGVMSRFVNLGMPLASVIQCATWNPARAARREELGNLSPSGPADIAVLNLEKGAFGFVDMYGARLNGTQKLVCEMTVRDGKIVFDRNGMSRPEWDALAGDYRYTGDSRWDAIYPAR